MTRPAGWYYGWNVIAVGVLLQAATNGLPTKCLSLFLWAWSAEFHVPISLILAATLPMMILSSLAGAFLIGPWADKKPARLILGFGVVGLALFSLGIACAQRAWQIQLLYALVYPLPSVASAFIVINALASRWFVRRLGLALGVAAGGGIIAGVALPPLVAAGLDGIGWRNLWLINTAFTALIVLPVVLLVIRDRPTEREGFHYLDSDRSTVQRTDGAHAVSARGTVKISEILGSFRFWRLNVIVVPLLCMVVGTEQNIVPLAVSHGLSQTMGGVLLSLLLVSASPASLFAGLLADRFGVRAPLIFSAIVAAAGGAICAVSTSMWILAGACLLVGLSVGVLTLVPIVAAAEFGAANVGRVYGLFALTLPLTTVASIVIARSKEVTGGYWAGMGAVCALCLVSLVIALFMREQRGTSDAAAEPPVMVEPAE